MNFELLIPFFKQYGIERAAVFGSQARNEAKKESDLDLIVSFSGKYDLLDIIGLKQDIEDAFHIPVDLITYNALKDDYFAQNVLAEEKVIYEQN